MTVPGWEVSWRRSWLAAAAAAPISYVQRFDHVAEARLALGEGAKERGSPFSIACPRGSLSGLQAADHRGVAPKTLASERSLALGRQLIVARDDEIGMLAITLRGQFPGR